ncbi:MAG TPA: GxxExxY protein [Burkholderiales bacterium]|nr:GxxExxY protein [Burkholderiales bacterium]
MNHGDAIETRFEPPRRQDAKECRHVKVEPSREADDVAAKIVDAAFEVHRTLGPGYLEAVYEQALAVELRLRGLRFEQQKDFPITYKGELVGKGKLDFLVEGIVVVELKSVDKLIPFHKAQVISYLKASGTQLGMLINFNEHLVRDGIRRIVFS